MFLLEPADLVPELSLALEGSHVGEASERVEYGGQYVVGEGEHCDGEDGDKEVVGGDVVVA